MTPPLPKPMSNRPTGMPQQRRKSSIRTASGNVQEQLIERCRQLAEDPTLALPLTEDPAPRPIRAIAAKLERMKAKGPGFFDRWDKGIVGAVAAALPIADLTAAPRVLDARIAGNRRFYLVRGHASRACQLGVQNHDDPLALLLAYAELARKERLHFFAGPELWCTGSEPAPPQPWIDRLAERTGVQFAPDGPGWSCPHNDRDRVALVFRGGASPFLAVCGPCGTKAEGLHKMLRGSYAGPQQKLPVEVEIRKADGTKATPAREPLAFYRAGRLDEAGLLRAPGAQSGA